MDLVAKIVEAGMVLLPHEPVDAVPKPPAPRPRRDEASRSRQDRKSLVVLQFPIIDPETPLGPSLGNPMGEGSEETALPVIDPVDVRLGQVPEPSEPLP